jgi:hypothetical protein
MKHLFFFGCAMIILISISCKKDSVNADNIHCNPCKTDSPVSLKVIYITDSNWDQQGQRVYKSDLTQLITDAGATVSEVYSLELVNEDVLFQFFPCCQINFKGGQLSGAIYSTGDEKTCTLTFGYADQNVHAGEFGGLPFRSIVIKVSLWN